MASDNNNDQLITLSIFPVIEDGPQECAELFDKFGEWLKNYVGWEINPVGGVGNLNYVWTGSSEPPAHLRGIPWIRSSASGFLGTWTYIQGRYRPDGTPSTVGGRCFGILMRKDCLPSNDCDCNEDSPWEFVDGFQVDARGLKVCVDTTPLKAKASHVLKVKIPIEQILNYLYLIDEDDNPVAANGQNGKPVVLGMLPRDRENKATITVEIEGDITVNIGTDGDGDGEIDGSELCGVVCDKCGETDEKAEIPKIKIVDGIGNEYCLAVYKGYSLPSN